MKLLLEIKIQEIGPVAIAIGDCQFHQHYMGAFIVQNFGAKNYKAEM